MILGAVLAAVAAVPVLCGTYLEPRRKLSSDAPFKDGLIVGAIFGILAIIAGALGL